jgi:diadenosine tetraphosphatase ApaH/serine/threonine PP2A family protein phosphatase
VKTAILSDIHSNLEALASCCRHAIAQGAERYVCLGDFVGYGADPGPTLDWVMDLPGLVAVRGNHDEALFRDMSREALPAVVEALAWTRERLTLRQLDFLAQLPYMQREDGVTYVHASAHRPAQWEYLVLPEQAESCLEASDTPLTFIGHVHEPRVFYTTAEGRVREFIPPAGEPIPLSPQARYVVSVGSVGQPRDGNNAACYVLHDEQRHEITFHRPAYDYLAAARKIRAARLDPFFAARLAAGR